VNINEHNGKRGTEYGVQHTKGERKYCKNYTGLHYGLSIGHTLIVPESRRILRSQFDVFDQLVIVGSTEIALGKRWAPFSPLFFLGTEIGRCGMCFVL
jgi:hypothetical protein